jgi:hypothetical protein
MSETEIGRIGVPRQPGRKKFVIPILTEKSWAWWHMSVIAVMEGSVNRRVVVQAGLGRKCRVHK